ncbi:unnamed protein product [Gongylonema pulchrum]|uniref:NRDE family protein n=1 Tax=Gongylonema pulchrum TaxID=637853 RepID=A0A183EW28_9BILA|nr:unnamed protein product [Gongylonema pulchrum]
MCVTFLYLNDQVIGDPKRYQLILLNNRDENFDRPTSLAAWQDGILCGEFFLPDLTEGKTSEREREREQKFEIL